MSTDQTGVNSPTSDDTTQDTRRAPRSSRRAIRQAERAAEREAILTGQQPLLTRREMRRLREEAKALQAAVEAGEITEEQARALQDPLAEQPAVEDRAQAAGSGLASTAPEEGWDPQEQAVAASQSVAGAAEAVGTRDAFQDADAEAAAGAPQVPGDGASEGSGGQPGWFDLASPTTSTSSGAGAGLQEARSQGQDGDPATLGGAADQDPAAEDSPSWRALTADEAVALSEIPTGLMDAVDLPIAVEGQWSVPEEDSGPAPVPARASLRERLETGQTPMVPGTGPASSGYPAGADDDSASAPKAAVGVSPGGAAAQPALDAAAWQGPSQGGQDEGVSEDGTERYGSYGGYGSSHDDDGEAFDGSAGPAGTPAGSDASAGPRGGTAASSAQPTGDDEQGQPAGAASAPSSAVRRPIVRIPAAAQGVRTVNASTGELSAVQPVGSGEEAGQQPAGDSFPVADAATFEDETSVIPADISAEFEDDAPQWPSLRQDASAAGAAAGQPMSPYSLPDQPGTERAQETAVGAFTSTEWDTVAAPRSAVALEDSAAQRSSPTGRILLIALIVLVIALVVAAVVWFVMSQTGGSSEAAGPTVLVETTAGASRLL
ncbi:hypothetical protein D5R93_08135 [Actinomyces lilanjuaniae]|uniref:Uncharacterized protein n=1 Tax=Actinomyces lilanjuaniae TaxID=2321394 RepID=A0ABM6Z3S1_9ACTO|nr:hypothetical protein [Actinomyces lilanjuaniae]AYD89999.1 hypothetical protein D5R93_08135 [Actinomyces lilanjuaniae]